MEMETIVFWFDQQAFTVHKSVAERLNLPNGYRIKTEKEFWMILKENINHALLICGAHIHNKN